MEVPKGSVFAPPLDYDLCDLAGYFVAILATTFLYAFTYAMHLALAGYALTVVLQRRQRTPHYRKHVMFIATLVVLGTVNVVTYMGPLVPCENANGRHASNMDHRDGVYWFVRTPTEQLEAMGVTIVDPSIVDDRYGLPYFTDSDDSSYLHSLSREGQVQRQVQDAAAWLMSVLVQCFLLYRCHLLLARKIAIGGLACLLTAVLALGLFNVVKPSGDVMLVPLPLGAIPIPRMYWALALAFNIGANSLIIIRLFRLRARVRNALGAEYGKVYTGIAAMLMESSLLYTVVMVIAYFLLPGSGGANTMFSPLVTNIEAIASELIILRFALGRAMGKKDVATVIAAPPAAVDVERNETGTPASDKSDSAPAISGDEASPRQPVWQLGFRSSSAVPRNTTFSQFPSSVAAVLRSHATSSKAQHASHPPVDE